MADRSIITADILILDHDTGRGIKVDADAPVYPWRDNVGTIKTRTGGLTVPTFAAYQGSIYQFAFEHATAVQEVFNEYHVPHDQVPNTVQYIHAHWSTIVTATGNVNWLFDVCYAKGYDQSVFEGTAGTAAPITVSVTQAGAAAFKHEIAEVQFVAPGGLISPAAVNVSITSGAPTLTAASALFTAADIGRTVQVIGAGTAGAVLNTTITGYTSTTEVTLADNAVTTVTAQDAFRYRVIDSSLIEVDGMFMVRTWHEADRDADTLSQTPFLHFVDIHYQSTGIGTKDKNYPFYT